MSKISFSVNDRSYETESTGMTVSEVLGRAGESADHCCLLLNGIQYDDPDQEVTICDGDRFETKARDRNSPVKRSVHYEVNGERLTADQETLTLEMILRTAGRAATIDEAQIRDYYLQNIADGRKYEDLSAPVTIQEGARFIAVHCGRTPVA